jgi:hypothetical protein
MISGIIISLLLGVTCAVTVVGALTSRGGSTRRNGWFGFRTGATMRSDGAWAAAQRAGWRRRILILPVYVLALVTSVVTTALGSFEYWAVSVVAVCGIAGLLTAVWSIRAASAAARAA